LFALRKVVPTVRGRAGKWGCGTAQWRWFLNCGSGSGSGFLKNILLGCQTKATAAFCFGRSAFGPL